MTYSSIIYSYTTARTTDISLPVPVMDAKTTCSFSTLHKLHKITSSMVYFFSTTF